MSLEQFPDISFIEDSTIDDVLNAMMADYSTKYQEITGKTASLNMANPYRLIMYAAAMQVYQAMQYIDFAGKMNLLKYARDEYLDNIAAIRSIERKEASSATTILKFSIETPIISVVSIPAGTRVTNNNEVFFATDEYAEITPGQTEITVYASCTEAGLEGMVMADTLTTLVDTLPYISGVTNTIDAFGGAEAETDEELRERIYYAPNSFSTAGPIGSYIYHTQNASREVGDVVVLSPTPGTVNIYFTTADGGIPSQALVDMVEAYLDDDTKRPLTDEVNVNPVSAETYNIDLTYYISESDKSNIAGIQENIQSAIDAYNIWQADKIGRDINPEYLTYKIIEAGAKRVVITEPEYTVVSNVKIASLDQLNVVYGGLEDD